MGDRVAVMRKGELQQVGHAAGALRPARQPLRRRLHRQPGDEHARGDARARERRHGRGRSAASGSRSARSAGRASGADGLRRASRSSSASGPEELEDAALAARRATTGPARAGRAARSARLGGDGALRASTPAARSPMRSRELAQRRRRTSETAPVAEHGRAARRWSAASAHVRSASKGETVEVTVDTRALHFFDPETGLGIYDATTKGPAMKRQRWTRVGDARARSSSSRGCGGSARAQSAAAAAATAGRAPTRTSPARSRSIGVWTGAEQKPSRP